MYVAGGLADTDLLLDEATQVLALGDIRASGGKDRLTNGKGSGLAVDAGRQCPVRALAAGSGLGAMASGARLCDRLGPRVRDADRRVGRVAGGFVGVVFREWLYRRHQVWLGFLAVDVSRLQQEGLCLCDFRAFPAESQVVEMMPYTPRIRVA